MKKHNGVSDERLDEMLTNYCKRDVPYTFRVKVTEKGKVNNMNNKPAFKYAAAAVFMVLAFTAGLFSNRIGNLLGGKNSFAIVANAASSTPDELKPSSTIKLDNIDMSEASKAMSKERIEVCLNFDVKCVGNNIKNIRYTSNYSTFGIYYGCDAVAEKSSREEGLSAFGAFGLYNTYLVNYDNQPEKTKNTEYPIKLSMKITDVDYRELLEDFHNYSQYRYHGEPDKDFDIEKLNVEEMLENLYTALFDKVSVDVLVTYEDGTTESKKIQIGYDWGEINKDNCFLPTITATME